MSAPRLRLRLTAAAESIIRHGHPWVYSDSIREQNRDGVTGELAVIFDRNDRFLAIGLYDSTSPIRVRILHVCKPVTLDDPWWTERLLSAVRRREFLVGSDTNGYRLVNGESDGWPGLVLDRYDDVLVLKIYTGAWLSRLDETVSIIIRELHPRRLVLRLSRNLKEEAARLGRVDGTTLHGPSEVESVIFVENGLKFESEVTKGQKTGFFLDQRDNRQFIGGISSGAEVLNAFSFSGGFSVYAARGGAKRVTDLDISRHALDSGARNLALNQHLSGVRSCEREALQVDVFAWLPESVSRSFDLVILDPPSLAKRESDRPDAIEAYARLAAEGMRRVRPGGWLLAASCSAHVKAEEFFATVRSALSQSANRWTEIQTTEHPPDHPATFPEGKYLKAIYLRTELARSSQFAGNR